MVNIPKTYTYMIRMKSREGEVIEEIFLEEAESKRRLKELFETKFFGMRITASGKSLYYAKDETSYWTIHNLKIQNSAKNPKKKPIIKDPIEHAFSLDEFSYLLVSEMDIPVTLMEMAMIEAERKKIQRQVLEEDAEYLARLEAIQNESLATTEEKQQAQDAEIKVANKRNIQRTQQVRRNASDAAKKWTLHANAIENPTTLRSVTVNVLAEQATANEKLESELLLLKPIDKSQQRMDENLFYCISISFGDNRDDIVLKYNTYAEAEECLSAFRSKEMEEPANLWRHIAMALYPEAHSLDAEATEAETIKSETDTEIETDSPAEEEATTLTQFRTLLSKLMNESASVDVSEDVTYLSCGESGDIEIKLFVHPKWMSEYPSPRNGLGQLGRLIIENNERAVIGNYLFNNYLTAQAYLMSGLGDTYEKIRLVRTSANQWYVGEDVAEMPIRDYVTNKLWKYRAYIVPRQ